MALPEKFFSYSPSVVTLEENKLFCHLSPGELKTLRRIVQERTLKADQEIFKEGDAGDGVYVVKDGLVEISVPAGQTGRHVFTQIAPGEIFGEMAVIEDKPRSAGAVARKESLVYFIPRAEMLDLIEHTPLVGLGLLREVSRRLREFNHLYMREVLQAERLAVVGRFARSIVHDLKNPLNIIGLTAEMASMQQATPEVQEKAMTDIRHQVERINELVSEILDFTQGSSSELVLPPMNYATFVHQTMDEIRSDTVLRSVKIEFENEPPSVSLLLNSKRLRRVFYNLTHNAIDALPRGGRIIWRFSLKPTEVVTEVEDTGPGIAPEIAGHLFEAFATHGKAHGTGLGLSICKKIIDDHRGWITAREEQGHGAIFAFGLPRIPEIAATL
jgi:signal transduction histidine kinase